MAYLKRDPRLKKFLGFCRNNNNYYKSVYNRNYDNGGSINKTSSSPSCSNKQVPEVGQEEVVLVTAAAAAAAAVATTDQKANVKEKRSGKCAKGDGDDNNNNDNEWVPKTAKIVRRRNTIAVSAIEGNNHFSVY